MDRSARVREIAAAAIRGETDRQAALQEILRIVDASEPSDRAPPSKEKPRDAQQRGGHVLQNIIATIPYVVFWKDRNSVFQGCNDAFAKVAGVSDPQAIVGCTDYDLPWKKHEADFFVECDRRVMSSGVAELNIEEPIKRADGSDRYLQTSKVPLRDENGEVVGILGIFADITERKQMELELRERNREIAAMLNSMQQGIFTIDENLTIQPEYSAHLEHILGSQDVVGRDCLRAIFEGSSVATDALEAMRSALLFTIGSDKRLAPTNAAHLVSEFHKLNDRGEKRYFEADWHPIADETDIVREILVTVRDVSLLRQLKETVAAKSRELMMLGQILDAGIEPFDRFSSGTQALLNEIDTIMGSAAPLGSDALEVCFRNLHTIKGNARTMGFGELVHLAHLAEEPYAALRRHRANAPDRAELAQSLRPIREAIESYEKVYRLKIGVVTRASSARAERALNDISALLKHGGNDNPARTLRNLQSLLSRAEAVPLDEIVKESARVLPSLASELGKEAPVVECDGAGLLLTPEWAEVMRNVLTHAFRNALDHGLEPRQEREARGKPPHGRIRLRVDRLENGIEIRLSDDGRGLRLAALRQRTSLDATDEEVADSIFRFGVSTAASLTPTSGRGVGMEAIQKFVRQHGGDVRIAFTGEGSREFRPFELVFELPGRAPGGAPHSDAAP